jgi:predicted GNAT superfamily acetyltransferase
MDRTYKRLRGEDRPPALDDAEREGIRYLLRVDRDRPALQDPPGGETHLLVEIPSDFQGLKGQDAALGLEWRIAARGAFEGAFGHGYAAVEFLRSKDGRGAYMLVPQPRRSEAAPEAN